MASATYVAERRAKAVARLTESAQWVSGDFGFKVPAPAAVKDVEIQRIGLLEYAADVLEAVRDSRLAERSSEVPAEGQPEDGQPEGAEEPPAKPDRKARK